MQSSWALARHFSWSRTKLDCVCNVLALDICEYINLNKENAHLLMTQKKEDLRIPVC